MKQYPMGTFTPVRIIRTIQTEIANAAKYPSPDEDDNTLDLWCDHCNEEGIMLESDHVFVVETKDRDNLWQGAYVCSLNCANKLLAEYGI